MTQRVIEVIVKPNGETEVETRGFAGSSCKQASAFLESALGAKTSEQLTAEFHQTQPDRQSLHQGGSV